MAEVTQIYELLNQTNKQMRNPLPITVANLSSMISYGKALQDNEGALDDWYKALQDRIGRTVNDVRPYNGKRLGIVREMFDYGATLQKLYTDPMIATSNKSWGVEDNTEYSPYVVHKLNARQKLFNGIDTWEFNPTLPDHTLFTAFLSAEALAAFMDSQRQAVQNSREMYIEALERLVYANFIGEKLLYAKGTGATGIHVVNLLSEYNTKFSKTLTAEQSLTDMDALKYFASQINMWVDYFVQMGTFFNTEGYYRHTPNDRLRVTLLGMFAKLVPYYLQADTYHDTLVQLPNYNEIPYWQAPGTGFKFADISSINLVTSGGNTIAQSGIIGMISDVDAIGMYLDKPRTKSLYNPSIEAVHYWYKSDVGYFNNFSENAVVFTITDTTQTVNIKIDNKQLTTRGVKKSS